MLWSTTQGCHCEIDGRPPSIETTPIDHWDRMLAINLTGPFLVCRAAVPLMKRNRWGRLVFIGSIGARMHTGNTSLPYASAKAGLMGLARLLAAELGRDGITVNTVVPGRIKTAMSDTYSNYKALDAEYTRRTPVGRIGEPVDVAAAVAYLASEEARFVNGAILDVNGGNLFAVKPYACPTMAACMAPKTNMPRQLRRTTFKLERIGRRATKRHSLTRLWFTVGKSERSIHAET